MSLENFLEHIKKYGYKEYSYYGSNQQIYYIQLISIHTRRAFLVQINDNFYCNNNDHTLEIADSNYKNFRQRSYLEKINLTFVACMSKNSLCIKDSDEYKCYLLDYIPQEEVLADPDQETEELDIADDIEIDDYPVEDIMPVMSQTKFIENINNCEEILDKEYQTINKLEEEMNEQEVQQLILLFDNQKEILKEKIFDSHKLAYNIRRDINKTGIGLKRIYELKKKSIGERDLVRFKIDRLANETEENLDQLNVKLRVCRNNADRILKKYREYLESFKTI